MRVPIAERRRVTFDLQRPHLARGDFVFSAVDNLCFVAFDDASQTAWLHIIGAIRDVDVEHLGRADAVASLCAKRFLPAMIKLDRQGLAPRITKAKAWQGT